MIVSVMSIVSAWPCTRHLQIEQHVVSDSPAVSRIAIVISNTGRSSAEVRIVPSCRCVYVDIDSAIIAPLASVNVVARVEHGERLSGVVPGLVVFTDGGRESVMRVQFE